MSNFESESLLTYILSNKDNIEEIKKQYLYLLSLLTIVEDLSIQNFIDKIIEINNIGEIIIFYIKNSKTSSNLIVGTGTVIFEPKIIHGGKYVAHIEDIVVHELYRSFGIATKILAKLENIAKEKESYKIILYCKENMEKFYIKNGFNKYGSLMTKYFL